MTRAEQLYEAITLVDDDLIDAAGDYKPKAKRAVFRPWMAAAACLVLVVGLGAGVVSGRIPLLRMGSNAPANSSGSSMGDTAIPGGSAEGSGANGGSTFMSYAGPVFPLTALNGVEGLAAERDITLDFASWASSGSYSTDLLVTDSYTLTNPTAEDKEVTLLYPFTASLSGLDRYIPALTVDSTEVETALHAGSYTGGFLGAGGADDGESWNLSQLDNWEEYKVRLSDGSYLAHALREYPDLTDIPAIVYEFTDPWGEERSSAAGRPNPTIGVEFHLDFNKTSILSDGFNGMSQRIEKGWMYQEFSIPQPGWADYGKTRYLIVIGEDIWDMTTGGYATGGSWDAPPTVEADVTVTRYETDLDTVLRQAAGQMFRSWQQNREDVESVGFELYYGLLCDYLMTYGVLSDNPAMRYGNGWLWDMDFEVVDRVFYLETTVTVPAGGSVEVTAEMTKAASFDFYGGRNENLGVYGYDLVTQLGSTLTFTGQTATLEDRGQIQIVRQNFGFDLENGGKTVTLDPAEEHYYLEVRRLS